MEKEINKILEVLVCYCIVEGCLKIWDIDVNKFIIVNLDGVYFMFGGDVVFKRYEEFYSDYKWERIKVGNCKWQGFFEKELDGMIYEI